jgi:ABC-type Mn2+/Zn2+ transport system ATPase subunit
MIPTPQAERWEMNVRIKRFEVGAFRSLKKATLEPDPKISCLVGVNGAGKTNLLQSFLLLKQPPRRASRGERDQSSLPCHLGAEFETKHGSVQVQYKLWLGLTDQKEEVVRQEEKWRFRGFDWSESQISSELAEFFLGDDRLPSRTRRQFFLSYRNREEKDPSLEKFENVPPAVVKAYRDVRSFVSSIRYCSASKYTNPSLCPSSFEIDEDGDLRETYSSSREHTFFLFSLYRYMEQNPIAYEKLISLVNKDGLKIIDHIEWVKKDFETTAFEVKTGANIINKNVKRRIVIPIIYIGESKLSFNQLSEGTYRTLALLHAIMSDSHGLLLLEEPEVSVHHGLLESIVTIARTQSARKQIILSTHSETVVDCFQPENMFVVQRHARNGTVVRSVTKSLSRNRYRALKMFLKEEGSLGEFWKSSGFDQ